MMGPPSGTRTWCLIVSLFVASVASEAAGGCPRSSRDELSSNAGYWTDNDIPASGKQPSPAATCGLPLFRLPSRIIPNNYDLVIQLNSKMQHFEGRVRVDVSVNKFNVSEGVAANKIVLHADKNLAIHGAKYRELDSIKKVNRSRALDDLSHLIGDEILLSSQTADADEFIKVLDICRDSHYQLVVLTLERDLRDESTGEIHLSFSSRIDRKFPTEGLFSSNLRAKSTITSHFEPIHAREMLPCFDEPALKATFNLYLICPANKTALSNTEPLLEIPYRLASPTATNSNQANNSDRKLIVFDQSPLMSTYLLALTVGDYEFIEDFAQLKSKKLRVRIYTRPGVSSKCLFALQVAIRTIRKLHELFDDDDYPLDKLDLVTVEKFQSSGMENWGLITMKESPLLLNASTYISRKVTTARVVIHELAHQWFGNLITMRWWNDLWLNEGFTTWLTQKLLDELYPELGSLFPSEHPRKKSLRLDSQTGAGITRPKMMDGLSVRHQFDYFTYERPAAVIGMFEQFFGPEEFWPSIREFVIRNKFKSVELNDLLDNFRRTENLAAMAEWLPPWLEQLGYPLIKFRLDGNKLHYKQKRFKYLENNLTDREAAQVWPIPVEVMLFDGKRQHTHLYLLDMKNGTVDLPGWWISGNNSKWIKIDPHVVGYYRVLCSKEMLCPSFETGAYDNKAARLSTANVIDLIQDEVDLLESEQFKIDPERMLTATDQLEDDKNSQVKSFVRHDCEEVADSYEFHGNY